MYDDILKRAKRDIDGKKELFNKVKEKLNELSIHVQEESKNKEKFDRKRALEDILNTRQIHVLF